MVKSGKLRTEDGGHVQVFFDASSFNRALSAVSLRLTSNMSLAANIVRDAVVEPRSPRLNLESKSR